MDEKVEQDEDSSDQANPELPSLEFCKSGSLSNRFSRSRSGSPANFDIRPFEKEKSPFLQVKQLLRPVKKTTALGDPDWKSAGIQLKPRAAPLALQPISKIRNQVESVYTSATQKKFYSKSSKIIL